MSFETAKIGMHVSSSGGGGIVTIYDGAAANAAAINTAFFLANQATTTYGKKTREALVDFILSQQAVNPANNTQVSGVAAFKQGRSGAPTPARLTSTAGGTITIT